MITKHGKGTGAIKDKKDKRDFNWHKIIGAITPFDWNKGYDIESEIGFKLPIKDQNGSFSCGGQAWSNYGNALVSFYEKKLDNKSALFIYNQTHGPDGGSAGRDNCALVKNQGFCSESLCSSYDNGNPPSEAFMTRIGAINDAMRLNASFDKALSYASVNCDIESVAQAIQANHGCIIGITGTNNGSWESNMPIAPQNNSNLWYHWVYAGKCKLINGKKYIGILNSWGNIGDAGWQWISEEYFKALNNTTIFNVWTLMYQQLVNHAFYTELSYGDISSEVLALQKCLNSIGISCNESGVYDSSTRGAVFEFQKKYVIKDVWSFISVWTNLGNNVGPRTIQSLNKIFA